MALCHAATFRLTDVARLPARLTPPLPPRAADFYSDIGVTNQATTDEIKKVRGGGGRVGAARGETTSKVCSPHCPNSTTTGVPQAVPKVPPGCVRRCREGYG